jgi:pimeloyl-ACP methyl ester carboxylesterase
VRRLFFLAALVVVAGCGGSGGHTQPKPTPLVTQGPIGSGAQQVWFYAAKGKPRSLVVFLHGYGGPVEETPANHVAWLRHLAAEGSDVIYPRYEVGASTNPYPNIDTAVREATSKLGKPHVPVIVIGYSRGGRVAIDYAALRAAAGHEPRLVLCVFPAVHAPGERLASLKPLDGNMRLVLMVGDKDTGVDGSGARVILARLELANFPASRIKLMIVRSNKKFQATHTSVLESNRGARLAFWKPTDKLIDAVR